MTKVLQLSPPAAAAPVWPDQDAEPRVQTTSVYVLFTTIEETLAAARLAGAFAMALDVPMTVLHFRTVSYSQPVDSPAGISPVETADFARELQRAGAGDAGRPGVLDARVQVFLCRDALAALPFALSSPSLVVIGGRRAWWTSRSARWRRALEARGHLVVLADRREVRPPSLLLKAASRIREFSDA